MKHACIFKQQSLDEVKDYHPLLYRKGHATSEWYRNLLLTEDRWHDTVLPKNYEEMECQLNTSNRQLSIDPVRPMED